MNIITKAFSDKRFLRWVVRLTLPIALQNLINISINTMDTIMVGQLGEVSIAAAGLANQVFFILSMILFGISSGCNVFVAQFWGKRDVSSIKRTISLSILIAVFPSLIFTAAAFFAPQSLMGLFTSDLAVIKEGSRYLKFIAISYVPYTVSIMISTAIRTVERPLLPLVTSIISLFTNTTLNYIFIFGKLGITPMGVSGAAIATTLTRLIELVIVTVSLYCRFKFIAIKPRDFTKAIDLKFIKPFIKSVSPVIMNETLWGLGTALLSVIYAKMGTGVVAATNIAGVFDNLFRALFYGIGYASGVIVGKTVGEGEEALAVDYGKRLNVITFAFGLVFSVVIVFSAPMVRYLYNVSDYVMETTITLITILGIVAPFTNVGLINIAGVLRSGGDVKYALYCDLGGVWLIAVPAGLLFGIILDLDIVFVRCMMLTEQLIKCAFLSYRVFKGKWVRNLVKNI